MSLFGQTSKFRGELTAVVTRADGTVEDLGVVARTGKRPLWRRLLCIA